jgi:hypothetical protein
MTRFRWKGWASVDLPQGWVQKDGSESVNIFRENAGVGALQMSFARRKRNDLPTVDEAVELARSFADQRGWRLGSSAVSVGMVDGRPFAMFSCTDSDSTFWQVWHVVDRERAAFITYVCESGDAEQERVDREAIVNSFRWD